MTVYIQDSIF